MVQDRRSFPVPWGMTDLIGVLLLVFATSMVVARWEREVLLEELVRLIPGWPPELCFAAIALGLQSGLLLLLSLGVVFYHRSRPSDIGFSLNRQPLLRLLAVGLGGGLILMLVIGLAAALLSLLFSFPIKPQPFTEVVLQAENGMQLAILLILGAVVAPIAEEAYFRGLVYSYLLQHGGDRVAVVGSAMIFAALHLDAIRFIPLFLGGMGLAWLREHTGSIYSSIVAHATWNGLMILILWSSKGAVGW